MNGLATAEQSVRTTPPTAPVVAASPAAETPARQARAGRRVGVVVVCAAIVFGSALTLGIRSRERTARELETAALAASAPPRVTIAVARPGTSTETRVLPGNALPLFEAAMFARTTGYVKERRVDIGDRVAEGQLLAVISSPEIDDQLAQAKADLAQAEAMLTLNEANAVLAKRTLARDIAVRDASAGAVTPQEIDERVAGHGAADASVDAAKASIAVAKAAVQRFTDLQAFQQITAPFPGVITARNIDPGDIVTADSTERELFHIMRTDILRVFVNVPQPYATTILTGQSAEVYRQEDPTHEFAGAVTRTADALDPRTRTLLTEVQVQNADNALRAGMYLQVRFDFGRGVTPLVIPTSALAIRDGAPRVGVLDAQHRVHYRTVELGRDYGGDIEVIAGLAAGESVVIHPGDDLPGGAVVSPERFDERGAAN